MTRWPKTLLTVAGTLIGVCVLITVARPARDEPAHREPARPGRVVNETPVLADLATRVPAPWGWRLLDTPADHVAYSGWLMRTEPDLAARVRSLRSDDTYVHIVGHQSVGCGSVRGPLLRRAGTEYILDFASRPGQPIECVAAVDAVVVFRVPRADARSAGLAADAGPATVAAHFALAGTRPSSVLPAEITRREDRDRLLDALSADDDRLDRVRLAADIDAAAGTLTRASNPARVFAFAVASCVGATPALDLTGSGLQVEISPACVAPVPSLAVFVVAGSIVPDGVTLR